MSVSSHVDRNATPIEDVGETGSTNRDAMTRAAGGARGPVWLLARRQTAGRGRSGRSWQWAEGNLAASLLFVPACPLAALHQISLVAGVATQAALATFPDQPTPAQQITLKWPNDLMIDGAKLGGILVESTTFGATTVAVVGIGINLAAAPEVPGRPTTTLARHRTHIPPPHDALRAIAVEMDAWLAVWSGGTGFAAVREAWLARAAGLGQPIEVDTGTRRIAGTFVGLDHDGALLIDAGSDAHERVTAGDVVRYDGLRTGAGPTPAGI